MDTARMLRQVTQPPHIAGPLAGIATLIQQSDIKVKNILEPENKI